MPNYKLIAGCITKTIFDARGGSMSPKLSSMGGWGFSINTMPLQSRKKVDNSAHKVTVKM